MTVWRYTAVPKGADASAARKGELAGHSAADVRAALRRIGLQVLDLRQVGSPRSGRAAGAVRSRWRSDIRRTVSTSLHRHLRSRRRLERAELFDNLATMLLSGLPLLEAVDTLTGSIKRRRSALRSMLVNVREELRSGSSLAEALNGHPSWFDGSEIAMVRAGQHSGTLPDVLSTLSDRHERSGELAQKLMSALAYPAVVAAVGLGVVIFLSVNTLPSLAQILTDAGIETPGLTRNVMALGRFLAANWTLLGGAALAACAVIAGLSGAIASGGLEPPSWIRRLSPRLLRRVAVARFALQLAELLRSGIPIVEGLRVLAPTARGTLRRRLLAAADRVEGGEDVSAALDDEHWFDGPFRRLLEVGQTAGELDALLERIGRRYARQAHRAIDRLAALLEPCVILALAVLVGTVVMAAVLPLLRLQEVL